MNLKNMFFSMFKPKEKVEDYFVNDSIKERRKSKYSEGICIESCGKSFFCTGCGNIENCSWIKKLNKYNPEKQSILIIDDNPGMVSFLVDDIENIFEDSGYILSDYNLITFDSKFAVYNFIATHQYYGGLNITKAIIDITYGGSVQSDDGNIRLTGVDVFKEIYRVNKDLKFIFYTGNELNKYIKTTRELEEQFKNIYHVKITDYVLHKTSLNIDERRDYIRDKLFGE